MYTQNRSIRFLCTLILLLAWIPSTTQAVALLSKDLTLYLPWIEYREQTYSAFLSAENGSEPVFRLNKIVEREKNMFRESSATVNDHLEISLPLVSYLGELYSVTLNQNDRSGFQVTNAHPFLENKHRGAVLSAELLHTKTVHQIAAEYPIAVLAGLNLHYDVSVYRVSYRTLDAFGNLTTASGVIGVPQGISAGAPLLSFQHGTITSRSNAPSVNLADTGADLALYLMGARGYLVMAPDYLGFGISDGLHPFMHVKTLAWTVIDLIRATRSLAADSSYPLNGQLFLAGYSEGGYATMAAQREIETHHADELTLTASAPMAGAYDLSGTMLQLALSDDPFSRSLYFPYVLLTYNMIYGFDDDITNLLAGDFADIVPNLFDGEHDSDIINTALPSIPRELFAPALLTALENDSYHPLKTALENNDVYRWKPFSPTRLYHCLDDDRVPYANALVALDYFTAAGADVILETLFFGNHTDCAVPALLRGNAWFDSLVVLP